MQRTEAEWQERERQLLARNTELVEKLRAVGSSDTEILDWLEKWLDENRYHYDLALQSDEEDGVWFAQLYRHVSGELSGLPMDDEPSGAHLTVRDALRAAMRKGRANG